MATVTRVDLALSRPILSFFNIAINKKVDSKPV